MLRVPQATANCFVFLETGVLPIEHEIWRRQFTYLHTILNLQSDDPVRAMYNQQKKLPGEKNWANNMEELRIRYNLAPTDEEIQEMDLSKFKDLVRSNIRAFVFKELLRENLTKSKTKHLKYTSYIQQQYITKLPPKLMYIMLRIRCGMLNTIHDRPYLFTSIDKCRLCGIGDESIQHILNCYVISDKIQTVSPSLFTDELDTGYAEEVARYVEQFYTAEEEVAELAV